MFAAAIATIISGHNARQTQQRQTENDVLHNPITIERLKKQVRICPDDISAFDPISVIGQKVAGQQN
jgi:hypothetical protein